MTRPPPLDNETMAHAMADAIFAALEEEEGDDLTEEGADQLYEQCLAEAYRMLADADYAQDGLDIPGFWKPFEKR
jgi:hypothetical protein